MNKIEWASFKSALRTLDNAPKRIKEASAEYAAADAYMKDPANRRNWSEVGRENFYKAAKEKRDNVIKTECKRMEQALATVRAYREYPGETIDLGSTKLQNALSIINMMGKRLPHEQQISILEEFRGQPATLSFLADIYAQNELYFEGYARDMAKPIDSAALENIEINLAHAEYNGEWDEGRIYWTKNAFAEAAERLGFDNDGADPFVTALKSMREGQNPDAQRVFSNAIYQLTHATENGLSEADKVQLFNDCTARVEAMMNDAEAREISRQAETFDRLETIKAAAAAAAASGDNSDTGEAE